MSLEITVLKGLSKQAEVIEEDGDWIDAETGELLEGFFIPYNYPEFAHRASDIELAAYYAEEEISIISMPYSDVWLFRAYLLEVGGYIDHFDTKLSYPGQEDADDWLMFVLNHIPPSAAGPFFEFIWFVDNEGTLGTKVSQKLYEDFLTCRDRAHEVLKGNSFLEVYNALLKGFKEASENGCMIFE